MKQKRGCVLCANKNDAETCRVYVDSDKFEEKTLTNSDKTGGCCFSEHKQCCNGFVDGLSCRAATPEPMSTPGVDDVLPELINDLKARTAVGVETYGKQLQTHIGRDALMDAYQESLDQCQYLKQAIMEREKPFAECIREWADDRNLYDTATPYSQMKKLIEEVFEWFDEVKNGNEISEKMELGDCMVALQNIANMRKYDLDECKWIAYHKIKHRSGKIINGTFVKD